MLYLELIAGAQKVTERTKGTYRYCTYAGMHIIFFLNMRQ